MLSAARRLFAKHGYAQTSIRSIAAEADVNHALVVTYFGGKEALFMEAVGRFQMPTTALQGDIKDMGARIARAYVERWENMAGDDPWLTLVRSSLSHGPSYEAMVECLIAGMILTRYIYRLGPAAELSAAAYEAAFASSLQQAITGPMPH